MSVPSLIVAAPDPILFDLDGTLTASGPGILASVRHALSTLGEPIPAPEVLDGFIGPPLLDSFQVLCGLDEQRAHALRVVAGGGLGQFRRHEGLPHHAAGQA